jgi:outer membrane lipoprotein SlyB
MRFLFLAATAALALAGCASGPGPYYTAENPYNPYTPSYGYEAAPQCNGAGVLGALGGAAAGGLIGNQIGHGTGKSLATGAGVLAGGAGGYAAGRSLEGC